MDASQVVTCKALSLAYWRITGEAPSIGCLSAFLSTKKNKRTMSYCKKKGIYPTVWYCLACEYCLPPSKRIGGRMCENEVMDKED